MTAVIDRNSFNKIKSYIDYVKQSDDAEILCGGKCDDTIGYFVEPTIVVAKSSFQNDGERNIRPCVDDLRVSSG